MQEDIINDFQKLMKPERNVSERVSDSFDTDILSILSPEDGYFCL